MIFCLVIQFVYLSTSLLDRIIFTKKKIIDILKLQLKLDFVVREKILNRKIDLKEKILKKVEKNFKSLKKLLN